LTEAVARNLHKLMAYKDEYEVARLLLLPEGEQAAQEVGGPEAPVSWHLHPPMLKALGMDSKLALGSWARPMFATLRKGKRLRGTRLDPFGRTEMRRTEAALPAEYLATMSTVYETLTAERLAQAVEIAGLPDLIRGYEDLKERRIAEYRTAVTDALARYID
ncbi:MAG: 2-oxoacid ferredoxin oxidoreductase, partial [Ilumatobacter sp.]|nr:2-oxoacid ferredoxin oxidoreductase [Ilumatobacter sp.]